MPQLLICLQDKILGIILAIFIILAGINLKFPILLSELRCVQS